MVGSLVCATVAAIPAAPAHADISADWSLPDLNDDMTQFLSTSSEWDPAPSGQWELPRTAPPESAWNQFSDGMCILAEDVLPTFGEKWAAAKLVNWVKTAKLVKPLVGKAVEYSVHKWCKSGFDNARKLASDLWNS